MGMCPPHLPPSPRRRPKRELKLEDECRTLIKKAVEASETETSEKAEVELRPVPERHS